MGAWVWCWAPLFDQAIEGPRRAALLFLANADNPVTRFGVADSPAFRDLTLVVQIDRNPRNTNTAVSQNRVSAGLDSAIQLFAK
jgi:hypothetical protein